MVTFAQSWSARILERPPLIAPAAQHLYPQAVADDEGAREDVAATALQAQIMPANQPPFLATFARGFAEPTLPHGIFPCPHPDWLCAAAGGYVYLVDTQAPQRWQQVPYRPVVELRAALELNLLLFVSFDSILAWGQDAILWRSAKLSDEGVHIAELRANQLIGLGWNSRTDSEIPFTLDLLTGRSV